MMSPVAILAAMAFWAPAHGGQPICQPQPMIHYFEKRDLYLGLAFIQTDGCEVWIRQDAGRWSLSLQCAVLAHELGHAHEGLSHTEHGVMAPELEIPRRCRIRAAGRRSK